MLARALFSLAFLTAVGLLAGTVRAGDPKAADLHFKRGKALLAAGHVAEACTEIGLAESLDGGVGTIGLLAGCHEQQGLVATAYREYRMTEQRAITAKDARAAFAHQQVERLEPTLPRVVVHVRDPRPDGLEVTIDQKSVPVDQLLSGYPVDPGPHVIDAVAPGRVAFHTTWSAAVGAKVDLDVNLVATPISQFATSAPPPPTPTPTPAAVDPPDSATPDRAWSRPAGIALIGVGGASVVAGIIFGAVALSDKSASDPSTCKNVTLCKSTRDTAFTFATISTATVIGGLVAVGGGTVLVVTAPKHAPTSVGLSLGLSPRAAAIGAAGTF